MAVVDKQSGEIIGAKEGSLTHYHELGHLEYGKTEKGIKYDYWCQSLMILTIIYVVLYIFLPCLFLKLCCGVSCALFIYFYIYEEVWCWKYALKHKSQLVSNVTE